MATYNETTVNDVENDRDMIQGKTSGSNTTVTTVEATMNAVCHILIALLTIYIIFKSFEEVDLYSWHPSCMAIGFLALMSEAILAFSNANVTHVIGYRNLVLIHWILQLLAAVCIFVGFATIYLFKIDHNKQHFKTNHATFGLGTTILVAVTSIGGIFTKYSYQLRDYVRPVYSKIGHATIGTVTFILSSITIVLGFYSNWYRKSTNPSIQLGSSVIVILLTLYIIFRPIKVILSRLQNICMRANL